MIFPVHWIKFGSKNGLFKSKLLVTTVLKPFYTLCLLLGPGSVSLKEALGQKDVPHQETQLEQRRTPGCDPPITEINQFTEALKIH